MSKRAIQWLYGELPGLVAGGVLSEDAASALRRHYGDAEPANRTSIAVVVFSILGALLIGLGIILVLAHNWDQMTRQARTVVSFAPLIAGQLLATYALLRRPQSRAWAEGAGTFLALSIGASISLIAQTYNISGDFGQFVLTWSLLALPIVYVLGASLPAGLYMIGVVTWMANTHDPWMLRVGGLALALIVAPHVVLACRRDDIGIRGIWLALTAVVTISIAVGIILSNSSDARMFLAAAGLAGVYYLIGAGNIMRRLRTWRAPFLVFGALAIVIMALIFSFDGPWPESHRYWYAPAATASVRMVDRAAVGSFVLAAIALLAWRVKQGLYDRLALGIGPVVFTAGYLIAQQGGRSVSVLLVNAYLLALGIAFIAIGLKREHLGIVNAGLAVMCSWVAVRFFDLDVDYVVRGVAFIVIGIGFIVTNVVLIRMRGRPV